MLLHISPTPQYVGCKCFRLRQWHDLVTTAVQYQQPVAASCYYVFQLLTKNRCLSVARPFILDGATVGVQTFLLQVTKRTKYDKTRIVKTVPCFGSTTDTCLVEVSVEHAYLLLK